MDIVPVQSHFPRPRAVHPDAPAGRGVPVERVVEGELLGRSGGRPFRPAEPGEWGDSSRGIGGANAGVSAYLSTAGIDEVRARAGLDCYA